MVLRTSEIRKYEIPGCHVFVIWKYCTKVSECQSKQPCHKNTLSSYLLQSASYCCILSRFMNIRISLFVFLHLTSACIRYFSQNYLKLLSLGNYCHEDSYLHTSSIFTCSYEIRNCNYMIIRRHFVDNSPGLRAITGRRWHCRWHSPFVSSDPLSPSSCFWSYPLVY